MTEKEVTGRRPGGFSVYLRGLYAEGPLRDVTRSIDIDSIGVWDWYCASCQLPFALIEDKYRGTSPPWPLAPNEWAATRALAREAKIIAVGVAWTNDCKCTECAATTLSIRVTDFSGDIHETTSPLQKILVRALIAHQQRCEQRAA